MVGSPVMLAGRQLSKTYGGVQVLFDVSIDLHAGEVHALIGENGAGKSTLMKILSGYQSLSGGDILLAGQAVHFPSSEAAEAAGIVLIHQEFNLAEQLTVEANIFLGREIKRGPFLDLGAMRARARALLAELETSIDPAARVSDLAVPDKQMVEIAKALVRDARILILDEPTAVLTPKESRVLFRQIARLRAQGVAILYTSHKLDEVRAIADSVTVLRDGRHVVTAPAATMTEDEMARQMVGRDLSELFPPKAPAPTAEIVLEVEDLTVPGYVSSASFHLRRGEILGVAGLVGSGRTELMEGLMGLRRAHGTVRVMGKPVHIRNPSDAAALGLAYLTEDRKGRGLLLGKSMRTNLTLLGLDRFSGLLIDEAAEDRALDQAIREFDIRAPRRDVAVGNLSGGNQQKLLLAKTMLIAPEIVIIDEPTRGIDIGTKQQIYGFIERLAAKGKSVIVISSEMGEVIGLSHRVIVMRAGRIMGELSGDAIGEDGIVRHAMGLEKVVMNGDLHVGH
jgi:ribose transport system ATP-binding protein